MKKEKNALLLTLSFNKCAICGKEIYLFGSKKSNTAHVDREENEF